jgi:hypothetical protein
MPEKLVGVRGVEQEKEFINKTGLLNSSDRKTNEFYFGTA